MTISLLAGRVVIADSANLPGHTLSNQEAEAKATTVFMAQLVKLDAAKPAAGSGEFVAQVIYVQNPANGIHPYRTTQNTTVHIPAIPSDLSFPVTMKVSADEAAPQIGKTYVFYAKDSTRPGTTGYEALKLAPTSDHGMGLRTF